ncbi:hypothetical protein ABH924_004812 [Arthrobacter sp. GAS37]|uniref:hypothetical protein n=1 Tax=Arthrobacter sp. GAS37 TaxID=3156261 RepID=UPI00383651E4
MTEQQLEDRAHWEKVGAVSTRIFWSAGGAWAALTLWGLQIGGPGGAVREAIAAVALFVAGMAAAAWLSTWVLLLPARRLKRAEQRRQHVAHMAAIFRDAAASARANGLRLVRIRTIYQVAQRGTKCLVENEDGSIQDVWFWFYFPHIGQVLVVDGGTGYGQHTHRDGVLYIGSHSGQHGVHGQIPPQAWLAAR